jgi:UDP-glucose 4-epimerase
LAALKIILTGGAGFIGSNIANALIRENHNVLIMDNFSSGTLDKLSSHIPYVVMDINSPSVRKLFKEFKPEVVIHNAAQVSVSKSMDDPMLDQSINIRGTLNILECCVESGVRKIIYPSSAAVYGKPDYLPIEESSPTHPESFYGVSKKVPEMYLQIYHKHYGLDYTVLRYSNVYGPGQDHKGEGGVISIFIEKFMNNKRPIIFGDGNQTRDFIYVKDVVAANRIALRLGSTQIYNISSNSAVTLNHLVAVLHNISGHPIEPMYSAERIGDLRDSRLDNSKAKKELQWEPSYKLADGLRETLQEYKNCNTD